MKSKEQEIYDNNKSTWFFVVVVPFYLFSSKILFKCMNVFGLMHSTKAITPLARLTARCDAMQFWSWFTQNSRARMRFVMFYKIRNWKIKEKQKPNDEEKKKRKEKKWFSFVRRFVLHWSKLHSGIDDARKGREQRRNCILFFYVTIPSPQCVVFWPLLFMHTPIGIENLFCPLG